MQVLAPELQIRLSQHPVIRGLAWEIVWSAGVFAVNVALVVGIVLAWPLVGPVAIAAFATVSAWALLVGTVAALAVCGCAGLVSRHCGPVWRVFKAVLAVDPVLAVVVGASALFGLLHGDTLHWILQGSMLFYYSSVVSKTLLGQVAVRCRPVAWNEFGAVHRYELFGHGLPLYFLFRESPMLGLALLELLQGVSTMLFAQLCTSEVEDALFK